jgi:hypothetical protein
MGIFRSFQIYSILLLITFIMGCRTVQPNSSGNKAEITPSPRPKLVDNSKTAGGRVVRKDGWKVPMPTKKKLFESIVDSVASNNGKAVKVTKNTYVTEEEDFIFTNDPFTSEEERQLVGGLLKLLFIKEFRVNGKVYAYDIGVRIAKPANHIDEIGFGYRIVDFDGDGKFETMLPDDDVELKVPAWAADGI